MGIRRGSISTPIIADGLVLNMDAANRASYVPDAITSYNTLDLSFSGSFVNDPGFVTQPISASSWIFDGVDDYIDCGSFTPLDSGSAVTISAWFKSPSGSYSSFGRLVNVEKHVEIFQGSTGASNTKGRFTYVLMGQYGNGFATLGGTSASGVGALCDGNWHHLCFVFSGATLTATAYEDGVAVVTGATTKAALNDDTQIMYIGADPAGANPITGNIANVHIYTQALSANEVLHNYNALKSRFL
tara:strand:- start:44 stop:775 length:732 start_codon:yes stop_codon:yes gene_type:complete